MHMHDVLERLTLLLALALDTELKPDRRRHPVSHMKSTFTLLTFSFRFVHPSSRSWSLDKNVAALSSDHLLPHSLFEINVCACTCYLNHTRRTCTGKRSTLRLLDEPDKLLVSLRGFGPERVVWKQNIILSSFSSFSCLLSA